MGLLGGDLGAHFFVVGKLADEPWIDGLIFWIGRGVGCGAGGCRAFIREIWSSGYGDVKVVRLELSGLIMRGAEEKLFGVATDPVETLLRQIRCATEDEAVRAILLEVDSPGGAVTPSDEIYEALRRFRASEEGRFVVVHVRDVGASGAYYVAMAADYLMAEPTAIVGSVGVIMQSLNMKGLSDKIGLSAVTIKSGENKDLLNPFEEVNTNQVALLQEVVDGMQDRFAELVVEARGLEDRALLDGRIFWQQRLRWKWV